MTFALCSAESVTYLVAS